MSEILKRREFVSRMWKAGLGLVGIAGAWTGWELLQPLASAGFGGKVRTLPPESVPETGVVEIPAARAYLARINDEIVAISEKCTHLGCRVPYCDSSGQFECPCHGTVFNRAGDYRAGPAPRGMDRYPVEVGEDGMIYVDTSVKISGPAPGSEQINEPQSGPMCSGGGH